MITKGNQIKLGGQFNEGSGGVTSRATGYLRRLYSAGTTLKGTAIIGDYLFFGIDTKIYRVDLLTLGIDKVYSQANLTYISDDGTYLYVAESTRIKKLNIDFSLVQSSSYSGVTLTALTVMNGYAYGASSTLFFKVPTSDLTSPDWAYQISGITKLKNDGTHIWAIASDKVYKLDPSDSDILGGVDCSGTILDVDNDGDNIYIIHDYGATNEIIKADYSDFSFINSKKFSTAPYYVAIQEDKLYVTTTNLFIDLEKDFSEGEGYTILTQISPILRSRFIGGVGINGLTLYRTSIEDGAEADDNSLTVSVGAATITTGYTSSIAVISSSSPTIGSISGVSNGAAPTVSSDVFYNADIFNV